MGRFSRRKFLKTGIAASVGATSLAKLAVGESIDGGTHNAQASIALQSGSAPVSSSLRQRILLDSDWRFHLGDADDPARDFGWGRGRPFAKQGDMFEPCREDFDVSNWRSLDLPHDWAVELPFVNAPELVDYGCKPLGRSYPATSIGWYRRVFNLTTEDRDRRISLEFDGVFRDCIVALNGFFLGRNLSGYAPFTFDITDVANFSGPNVLVVRADATEHEGWFYEGAGIYRHVWLVKTHSVHVPQWGTFVRSEIDAAAVTATLTIITEVNNASETEQRCQIRSTILDPTGAEVGDAASSELPIAARTQQSLTQTLTVRNPAIWSVESPKLYRLVTKLHSTAGEFDQYETTFGIRTIHFDADHGFFLNGSRVELKGTCNHQDHAGVGVALPDALQSYRIEKLKAMGSNASRTAHNPPTPELLDACDRLGMLVLDETRMFSSSDEGLSQLERMIRRDRNHPSVFCWSLGNEEWAVQGNDHGRRIGLAMREIAKRLDPSRPVTVGMDSGYSSGKGTTGAVDVQGFNYQREDLDAFHRHFPKLPTMGTETASTYSTRGIYANDKNRGYVSAYDVNRPDYGATAEQWWTFYAAREFLAGGFVWTGFDYRGEPSPYAWPCISSHFGILDTCGFPKDNFFYYKAWWGSEPLLHLFPHWNWQGREGQGIDVWCHSNLDSVELFLNGTSLGSKNVDRNSHVDWKVKYSPGVLEARGTKNGRVVLTDKRETTGQATRIALRIDSSRAPGASEDAVVIVAEVHDDRQRVVPTASNAIHFALTGAGRLIGVGNGDASCHESDKGDIRSAFNGMCVAIVQVTIPKGEIRVTASSPGLQGATLAVTR